MKTTTYTIDWPWFESRLADAGINQAELARRLQFDRAQVTNIKKGMRPLNATEIAFLADLFNEPIEEVARAAGVQGAFPSHAQIKLSFGTDKNGRLYTVEPHKVASLLLHKGHKVAVQISTAGVFNGWTAVCEWVDFVPNAAVGKLCVIRAKSSAARRMGVIKGVVKGSRGDIAAVEYINGELAEAVEIASASPVLWMQQ
jgi:transcriptional regulator with XRE-family HTH domain